MTNTGKVLEILRGEERVEDGVICDIAGMSINNLRNCVWQLRKKGCKILSERYDGKLYYGLINEPPEDITKTSKTDTVINYMASNGGITAEEARRYLGIELNPIITYMEHKLGIKLKREEVYGKDTNCRNRFLLKYSLPDETVDKVEDATWKVPEISLVSDPEPQLISNYADLKEEIEDWKQLAAVWKSKFRELCDEIQKLRSHAIYFVGEDNVTFRVLDLLRETAKDIEKGQDNA